MKRHILFATLILAAALSRAEDKIKVACVGDSITEGYALGVPQKYPTILSTLLGPKYEVRNFGVSGATLTSKGDKPYIKEGMFKDATEFAPNMVIVKLGTNDSKPWNLAHKESMAADLTALVEHFEKLPSKPKVILCVPVPVYGENFGITEKNLTEAIIPIVKKVATEKKLQLIDLYTALSGKPEMFPDKIHPNAAGAELIAKTVSEALKK
ncbi:MAG TPA: GDSL-type esterase/lipase family protein [Planctomycetota bacterium]|nr:GDSL-type esterase/lipase family protein [Planctomycetota bacterium]